MRAGVSLGWRVATAMAFVATAALAVTLTRGAPLHVALTSDKGASTQHASASPRPTVVTGRCAVSGLRISLGPGARMTTVITQYPLDFTNVSRSPCTLVGYPEVSAYRGDHVQVGPDAAPDPAVVARRVLLAPGGTAHAALDATAPQARCRPVRASGLRVVMPGQTAARYVPRSLTTCTARVYHSQYYLHVRAIQAGPGTSLSASTSPAGGAGPRVVGTVGTVGTVADFQPSHFRPSHGAARRVTPAYAAESD
jgi:Protein of unknown function (DUF4232)